MTFYTLLDKDGNTTSIAVEESAFDKAIVRHPETNESVSYKDLGYMLGFEAGGNGEAYNPSATRAAAKAHVAMTERAAEIGIPVSPQSSVHVDPLEVKPRERQSKSKSEESSES